MDHGRYSRSQEGLPSQGKLPARARNDILRMSERFDRDHCNHWYSER